MDRWRAVCGRGGVPVMAKQYRQRDSGLMVPDWMPTVRERRRANSCRGLIFTPGGGAAPGCHCFNPCGTAGYCPGGTPSEIEVTIAGVTNGTCSYCASRYNGTFICSSPLEQHNNCEWLYTFDSPNCTNGEIMFVSKYRSDFGNNWGCTIGDSSHSYYVLIFYRTPDFSGCYPDDFQLTSKYTTAACGATAATCYINAL